MIEGTHVSGNEDERRDAFDLGYRDVCTHPSQIGVLEATDLLMIDFDRVLFDDQDVAIERANEAANRGVLVGIYTYYPDDPRLQRFMNLPNVVVAETHARVLAEINGRHAQAPVTKLALALPD